MWNHAGRLAHPLAPSAYHGAEQHERERTAVFEPSWGFALCEAELPAAGEVRGVTLGARVVRFARDVAGHVTAQAAYGAPARRVWRELDVCTLGALVFVAERGSPRGLAAPFDDETRQLARASFTASHRIALSTTIAHPCNWKIALENVLETYHVPVLHDSAWVPPPAVFRLFTGTPPGVDTHRLGAGSTTYRDSMGAEAPAYRWVAEQLRPGFEADYAHHHAFPNLVLARTHLVSFVQSIWPVSPTRSESHVRLLLHEPEGASTSRRLVTRVVGRAARAFMTRVLAEDAAIYPAVQRGVASSPHAGVLSAREERVHAFQRWIVDRTG